MFAYRVFKYQFRFTSELVLYGTEHFIAIKGHITRTFLTEHNPEKTRFTLVTHYTSATIQLNYEKFVARIQHFRHRSDRSEPAAKKEKKKKGAICG